MNHFPPPNPDNIKATLIEWERIAYNDNHPQIAALCDGALQQILLLEQKINEQDGEAEEAVEMFKKELIERIEGM